MCVQSMMAIRTNQQLRDDTAMLIMVLYSLRLFVVGGEYYCHGNGSGGTHLYTKYHGRTKHYLLVNPRRACTRVVQCVCVCMSVCLLPL